MAKTRVHLIVAAVFALSCASAEEPTATAAALTVADCPPGSNVIIGTSGDDTITGTNGPDCIFGLGGNDTIDGGNGDDFIVGGDGSDDLRGGNGADQIFGDDGDDTIAGGNGPDLIDGGPGNDVISGDNGPDTILGGTGNDVILDSHGPSTIDAGPGTDSCSAAGCELPAARRCATFSDCRAGERCIGGACLTCLADSECPLDEHACNGLEECVPVLGCEHGVNHAAGTLDGTLCVDGAFSCAVDGEYVCDGTGGETCNAVGRTPSPDNDCDGTDQDCDGILDEGFVSSNTTCASPGCSSTGRTVCLHGLLNGVLDTCFLPIGNEVCDGLDNDCDGIVDNRLPDSDGDGTCDERDACPFHPAPPSTGDMIRGRMLCIAPGGDGPSGGGPPIHFPLPLVSFPVRTAAGATTTDCQGHFSFPVPSTFPLAGPSTEVVFSYRTAVRGPAGTSSIFQVTDDLFSAWGTGPFHFGFNRTAASHLSVDAGGRRILTVDPIIINTSECELFRIGAMVVEDYQRIRRQTTPREVTYMRRAGAFSSSALHTQYDYVDMPANVLVNSAMTVHADRELTLFHESGHVFRHMLDGDRAHWDFDSGVFRYGRICHTGDEVTESGFAFNEGWANYWRRARWSTVAGRPTNVARSFALRSGQEAGSAARTTGAYCGGEVGLTLSSFTTTLSAPNPNADWVENLVADHLMLLAGSGCAGATPDEADAAMMRVLERHPLVIHKLFEFETRLCEDVPACCGVVRPVDPGNCPPGWSDTGFDTCAGFGYTIRHP